MSCLALKRHILLLIHKLLRRHHRPHHTEAAEPRKSTKASRSHVLHIKERRGWSVCVRALVCACVDKSNIHHQLKMEIGSRAFLMPTLRGLSGERRRINSAEILPFVCGL